MSAATDELERLIEEAVPCLYVSIKRQFADATHPELVNAVRMCREEMPCPACRKRVRLLTHLTALREENNALRRRVGDVETSLGHVVRSQGFIKLFESATCFLCGYSGAGYFQPSTHPCAEKYHAALAGRKGEG